MADARIPERYLLDKRVLRLSHEARSSLFMATTWSMSNRTDGRVERADLALIPTFSAPCVPELIAQGLWAPDGDEGWLIVDYARDQTSREEFEVLENARRREREKKRRQRARSDSMYPGTIPGDGPGGQHRQGKSKARQEQGQDEGEAVDQRTGVVTEWPTAVPGRPGESVELSPGVWSEAS
ncbi:hypothetical protein [Microbacterium sp.]|uniref:hypothetical protein n=1 Tax=Microbacterium sp. TaxID=51671 RepID=UPI003242135A